MTERQKQEIFKTLKAKPVDTDDENSVQLTEEKQVVIVGIKDISTAHGTKTIATIEDNDRNKFNLFLNSTSLNTLIDAYGSNDEKWLGKIVNLVVESAPEPFQKTKMIAVKPVI